MKNMRINFYLKSKTRGNGNDKFSLSNLLQSDLSEAAVRRCSSKELFLKIRNVHRKTPVLESHFNNVADLQPCSFIKKRLQRRYFPVNIAKFLISFS